MDVNGHDGGVVMEKRETYLSDVGERVFKDSPEHVNQFNAFVERKGQDRRRGRVYWRRQYLLLLKRLAQEHSDRVEAENLLSDLYLAVFGGRKDEISSVSIMVCQFFDGVVSGSAQGYGSKRLNRFAAVLPVSFSAEETDRAVARFECFVETISGFDSEELLEELGFAYDCYTRVSWYEGEMNRRRVYEYVAVILEQMGIV